MIETIIIIFFTLSPLLLMAAIAWLYTTHDKQQGLNIRLLKKLRKKYLRRYSIEVHTKTSFRVYEKGMLYCRMDCYTKAQAIHYVKKCVEYDVLQEVLKMRRNGTYRRLKIKYLW